MKNLKHTFCIVSCALALGACSSSSSGSKDGGGGNSNVIPLTPTDTGFVQDSTTGIDGAWNAEADSIGTNANLSGDDRDHSDCVLKGMHQYTDCSHVDTPTGGQPFMADPAKGMCTTGTAAMVLQGTSGPDYTNMWGAGIGLDLNNPGGDAGAKGVWDGSKYSGVSFDITPGTGAGGIVSKYMRVNFPFTGEHGTDSPYYLGAGAANSQLPAMGGHVEIHWSDVGGPMYLTGASGYPFDKTKIQSIQFQVFTNVNAAVPYSFCVNNLSVLK
jgi:hypothetical protein